MTGYAIQSGQPALSRRARTHPQSLAAQRAVLAEPGNDTAIRGLAAQSSAEPAIALLDAWAVVADVVSFYSERLANEGYLRTATERRSVRELARTLGHELRPGVAARTHLVFTVEDAPGAPLVATIPAATPVQSVPGPDQVPQTFETSEAIEAHAAWNAVPALATAEQLLGFGDDLVWVEGRQPGLKSGDTILVVGDERADYGAGRTRSRDAVEKFDLRHLRSAEVDPPGRPGWTLLRLDRPLGWTKDRPLVGVENQQVWLMTERARLFGATAPDPSLLWAGGRAKKPPGSTLVTPGSGDPYLVWDGYALPDPDAPRVLEVDGDRPAITPGSWVVLEQEDRAEAYVVTDVEPSGASRWATSGKLTRLTLDIDDKLDRFDRPAVTVHCVGVPLAAGRRAGGPLPADPAAPGPFAIRAGDGSVPAGVTWADLVVTPGRYYVDGALVESFAPGGPAVGWPLTAQPFGGTPEPPAGDPTRFAVYLEATDHEVTADEAPRLRETALGGPDTSVRRQTTWQVRWSPLTDEVCPDLGVGWLARTPRTMVAGLRPAPAASDPCRIVASGGFQGLENQLYRVQVHDVDGAGGGRYLWSRENGAVVAAALTLGPTTVTGADARLAIDREGRDAELDIVVGNLVELTSTDRQLQREPGFLATVVQRTGLDLDVAWLEDAPAALADLGSTPIVRRWEGGPTRMGTAAVELELGITVRFPTGGEPRTGDHWQVPARAVQLAYGLAGTSGTIEWPPPGATSDAAGPLGPVSRVAALGILERSVGDDGEASWTLGSDCRRLFPPLTGLATIDLVGGDGQEALPAAWLDEPVRVVVRNGVRPVVGARVRFTASDAGELGESDPPVAAANPVEVETGADGVASVRWLLDAAGPVTQVLTAQRLDDRGAGFDVAVRATARLSVAAQVAFTRDGCAVFEGVATVDDALNRLATRVELRLQGGDGQEVLPGRRRVLPQPIRVIADSACGPVGGVPVLARATDGAHVRPVREGEDPPHDISNDPDTADVETGRDGAALFWWQPQNRSSDTLEVRLRGDGAGAPIVVSSQWASEGGGQVFPGAHIVEVVFGTGQAFDNDSDIRPEFLREGVVVRLDEDLPDEMTGKPVLRLELDLPWPVPGDGDPWGVQPVGTRVVALGGAVRARANELHWVPNGQTVEWLVGGLWSVGDVWESEGVGGRVVLDGWGVRTAAEHAVNTHTELGFEAGRLLHRLPTDDLVAGGTFTQWFRLRPG